MSSSYYKGKLASQPPLKKVNQEYYNPFVHTPPTGLEKNITLRSLGPRQPVTVTQTNNQEYKVGEDANKDDEYGQFVEMGGRRRRRKSLKKKKSKSYSKINKRNKKSKRKRTKRRY
jgi:hypothetical protein